MGARHAGRKLAMQILYQVHARKENIHEFLDTFLSSSEYDETAKAWGKELAINAWEFISEADKLIQKYAIGWSIERMDVVDLSILRLAFFELNKGETPVNVVLDEALELAKEFSSPESPRFLNGILGKYVSKKCSPE